MPTERVKTGGRTKGTPNKKTRELQGLIDDYGHNPVEALVNVAMNEDIDPSLRTKVNLELMQYLYPKRKAVEHTGPEGGPIQGRWTTEIVSAKDNDSSKA